MIEFKNGTQKKRDMLLSFETSQRNSSVAVGSLAMETHSNDLMSESIDTSDRLVEDVLPAIERLFTRAGIQREQVGAVALNAGPGGFTGLRIAHAAAQVIAESMSIPIVHISAAVVAKESAIGSGLVTPKQTAWIALAAKSDGCWMAKVSHETSENNSAEDVAVRTIAHWPLKPGEVLIADEHLPESWRDRAREFNIEIIALKPNAAAVLRVARRMLAAHRTIAPEHALVMYPREAEAVRLWRERHGTP
ncbi:MAG: tRNA (adenosine(37)-N6)-threonylcarbamoyltransferase complex dimerization subunit type 1 TsaB [Phycisphaerales bacterium]|nr:tRNA (adenosine(37)-N6)-threonylcarbamoyltransferase complex dimerization subunit type 1 TsaB [Phycisphaerales bacterium]